MLYITDAVRSYDVILIGECMPERQRGSSGQEIDVKLSAPAQAPSRLFEHCGFKPLPANGNPAPGSTFEPTAALDLAITPHNLRDTAASLAIQAGPRWLRLRAFLAMSRLPRRSFTMQGSSRPTLTRRRSAARCRERSRWGPVSATSCHWLTGQALTSSLAD